MSLVRLGLDYVARDPSKAAKRLALTLGAGAEDIAARQAAFFLHEGNKQCWSFWRQVRSHLIEQRLSHRDAMNAQDVPAWCANGIIRQFPAGAFCESSIARRA